MWEIIVWVLPAISTLLIISTLTGFWGAGIGLAFVWFGWCIYQGAFIVKQQDWVVIERLGKFHRVYFSGWHLRVIGIDTERSKGTLMAQCLKLYQDEGVAEMDFIDASAD